MDQYQEFIHLSRYARWNEVANRRETWNETIQRYVDFFGNKFPGFPKERIYDAIVNMRVMPSMRAIMTAGPALERDNIAGYNCSYLPIDHPRAFDEALYILMCFAPETLVRVKEGTKPISKLTIDDEVLSYDESNKEFSYIKPSKIFETETAGEKKLELTFADGSTVLVTDNHKFLTHNRGWVEAKDLTENDDIVDNL